MTRGIRIVRGYCVVRIMHKGKYYHKSFGRDSSLARELAQIHLAEKRKEILMGRFGVSSEPPVKRFAEAAPLYFSRWSEERTPEGQLKHGSAKETERIINKSLISFFGRMFFHEVRPADVIRWREKRSISVSGTSVNREQAVLSSIFSHLIDWVQNEEIPAFKLPTEKQSGNVLNPCLSVEMAETVKRERIVTPYEISKLKLAARDLGDENARENICLAIKTCLSRKDLKKLKLGDTVDLRRTKTGVRVVVPITVLYQPDWSNWRKRWAAVVAKAGIGDIEFRDLRKAGGNLLLGKHDLKLISQYMGHADQKTTEAAYTKLRAEKMGALAKDLSEIVDAL
jgi:integrase